MRTAYGTLDYAIRSEARGIGMTIGGKMKRPPGGVVLRAVDERWRGARTTVNGNAAHWRGGELRIGTLPATIFIALDHTKGRP